VAETWIAINNLNLDLLQPTRFRVEGAEELRADGRYLLLANHQSAMDIPLLQRALSRRIPLLRFFIKQQLIWVPVLGLAWWALGFPFMKRSSRAQRARRPELRGADLRAARQACERLASAPLTMMNFVEGTRFSAAKHQRCRSPYRHLLAPRAGGAAVVVAALGEQLDAVLDVTLHYPAGVPSLMDLFFGRVPEAVVKIHARPVPDPALAQAYLDDPLQREPFVAWLGELWAAKDDELAELVGDGEATELMPQAA
jgi:1-acyl-sn-glycerol-3-phosphate acyltransferase